jgi:allantoinase
MVDAHVHCLSDGGEGITAGTRSAAAGGVTTIIEMPFDGEGPITTAERLADKIGRVRAQALVDVALLGTVRPEGGWTEIGPMAERGAIGFKVSTFNTDSARFPRSTIPQFREIMAAIAAADTIVCVHAESDEVIRPLIDDARNQASEDPRVHGRTRPPVAEELGVTQVLATAREAGARAHLCHLSLPQTVRLAGWYRDAAGADITVETCPHYLLFTEDDVDRERGRLKINPPIRTRDDVEGLWGLLADGAIDLIASDHAPWSVDKKTHARMLDNHSGVPGVETIYATVIAEALRRGPAELGAAVRAMTRTPAERYRLARKGRLATGYDADIAIFDPSEEWTIDEDGLHSNARWSPYHGMTVAGRIVRTISRGVDVWDGADVLAAPAHGGFLRPDRPRAAAR